MVGFDATGVERSRHALARLRRPLGRCLLLRRLGLAVRRSRVTLPRFLGRLHRVLERGHQIDDLLGLGRRGRGHELLAVGLALDHVEHGLAVGVVELLGHELAVERLDQLTGHRQLLLVEHDVVELGQLGDGDRIVDLVGVHHRREQELAVLGPDRGQVLLGAQHEVGDADLAFVLHRLGEEGVGLTRLVRREVVRAVVEDRVDVDQVDELVDVDRAHRLGIERRQLFVADHDERARRHLVALDDLLPGHLLAGVGGDALLLARVRSTVHRVD